MNKKLIYAIIGLVIIGGGLYVWQQKSTAGNPWHTQPSDYVVLGTFKGLASCADCAGIDTSLTLTQYGKDIAEGTYSLSEAKVSADNTTGTPLVTTGTWTTIRGTDKDENATVYELNPDGPLAPRYFQKVSDVTIRPLDAQGHVIVSSDIPSDLTMEDTAQASMNSTATVDPAMVGTWKSTDDAKFTRTFKADGTVTDAYAGEASATETGTYTTVDPLKEPSGAFGGVSADSLTGMTVLKLTFPKSGVLYFGVNAMTETSLKLTYIGRGNILSFTKVK